MRIVVAPRARIVLGDALVLGACSSSREQRVGLLPDLGEEARARLAGAGRARRARSRARHGRFPPTSTRSISSSSVSTTTSAGSPARDAADRRAAAAPAPAPRSPPRPPARAARRARAGSGSPSSIVSVLPASTPPGPARDAVADLDVEARRAGTSRRPARRRPSRPSRARRGRAPARQTTLAVSGARWTPSRMICTTTSSRASAAPAMPGSRCRNGRIALKRCVTVRTPASNAAFASSAVASEWPHEIAISRAQERLDQLVRARQLGRERDEPDGPRREQPLEQRDVRVAARALDGWMPRRRGERNGPSRWTPRIRGPSRGASARRGARRGACSSGAVMNVGR